MTERKKFKVTYSTLASPDPLLHQYYEEAVEQAKALLDTAPGGVGVIMGGETRYMRLPPNSLLHFRSALRATHPNTRVVVIVTENPYLSMVIDTLTRISGANGGKLKFVNTMEEARALIRTRLTEEPKKTE